VLAAHKQHHFMRSLPTLLRTVVEFDGFITYGGKSRLDNEGRLGGSSAAWLLGNSAGARSWPQAASCATFTTSNVPPSFCPTGSMTSTASYTTLCSLYPQASTRPKAIVTIRGTNQPAAFGTRALRFWARACRCGFSVAWLDPSLSVRGPQSPLPVDLCRKFGFNPPIGLFF